MCDTVTRILSSGVRLEFKPHVLSLEVLLSYLSLWKLPSAPFRETALQVAKDRNRTILKLPLLLMASVSCIKNPIGVEFCVCELHLK